MRKTSTNNGSAHAHNLYYSSAPAQNIFTNGSAHAHNFYYSSAHAQDFSVPKLQYLYAKYRHILTPKSTTVEDYVCQSHRWHNHNISRTATPDPPCSCMNETIPKLVINNPIWT
jgi:hypothetical protein